jgi:hypothetical protein
MNWEEEIDRDFEIFGYIARDPEWLSLLSLPLPKRRRQRKPSLARLVAKAKQLGVDVTLEPSGAVTFHCSSAAPDAVINEWDEVLPRHGTH